MPPALATLTLLQRSPHTCPSQYAAAADATWPTGYLASPATWPSRLTAGVCVLPRTSTPLHNPGTLVFTFLGSTVSDKVLGPIVNGLALVGANAQAGVGAATRCLITHCACGCRAREGGRQKEQQQQQQATSCCSRANCQAAILPRTLV